MTEKAWHEVGEQIGALLAGKVDELGVPPPSPLLEGIRMGFLASGVPRAREYAIGFASIVANAGFRMKPLDRA